ncbi:hypothetical protein D3C72_2097600 [compost metagenome]
MRRVETVLFNVFEVEGAQVDLDIIEWLVDQRIGQKRMYDIGLGFARTVLLGLGFGPLGAFLLFIRGGHGGEFLIRCSHVHGLG